MNRSVDVTGLPEEAISAVEHIVSVLRERADSIRLGGTVRFSSREEWIQATRAWAASHPTRTAAADWSRESADTGRGD